MANIQASAGEKMKKRCLEKALLIVAIIATGYSASANQNIKADLGLLVYDGSCIGFDCVRSQPSVFSTIKSKSNLRVEPNGRSTSNRPFDWLLRANIFSNGGDSYSENTDILTYSVNANPFIFPLEAGADAIVKSNGSHDTANNVSIPENKDAAAEHRVAIFQTEIDFNQLLEKIDNIFTGITAVTSFSPMALSAPGETTINIDTANYKGDSAIGISFAHRLSSLLFNDSFFLNCRLSYAHENDDMIATVGTGWVF